MTTWLLTGNMSHIIWLIPYKLYEGNLIKFALMPQNPKPNGQIVKFTLRPSLAVSNHTTCYPNLSYVWFRSFPLNMNGSYSISVCGFSWMALFSVQSELQTMSVLFMLVHPTQPPLYCEGYDAITGLYVDSNSLRNTKAH